MKLLIMDSRIWNVPVQPDVFVHVTLQYWNIDWQFSQNNLQIQIYPSNFQFSEFSFSFQFHFHVTDEKL